ncbi:hypothetical protein RF11_07549 [Thelohanellus kitauei]|uniref:Uncharacterized protein n=1 Tax=Thelohanellus kitauei TaxID=669202 RepID=A0A0C2MRX0_THEKT|nr:hypothetical protein RF11_07549 [Thelohanellus kitauei]
MKKFSVICDHGTPNDIGRKLYHAIKPTRIAVLSSSVLRSKMQFIWNLSDSTSLSSEFYQFGNMEKNSHQHDPIICFGSCIKSNTEKVIYHLEGAAHIHHQKNPMN